MTMAELLEQTSSQPAPGAGAAAAVAIALAASLVTKVARRSESWRDGPGVAAQAVGRRPTSGGQTLRARRGGGGDGSDRNRRMSGPRSMTSAAESRLSDAELVRRCREGSDEAWAELVARFSRYVHAICSRGFGL